MEASVKEIHRYPLRPEGFEEPLFPTAESRRVVADHLLGASWLSRASEVVGGFTSGQAVHVRRESIEVENVCGRVRVSWASGRRRCGRRLWVVEVFVRWREVAVWWDGDSGVDRTLARMLLSDGSVVDLAREDARWFLVGMAD